MIFESPFPSFQVPDTDIHSHVFSTVGVKGSHPALIDSKSGHVTDYQTLLESITLLSTSLYTQLNFQKWDVVAIYSPNNVLYPIAVHAVIKAGGTICPVNAAFGEQELRTQLSGCGAKFLVVHPDLINKANTIKNVTLILLGESTAEYIGTNELIEKARGSKQIQVQFSSTELETNPAYLVYSSGTTGLPKGVILTHRNVISNLQQFLAYNAKTGETLVGKDVWIGVLPFSHVYGLVVGLHLSFLCGLSLVVMQRFEMRSFLDALERYEVTSAHLVPPIVVGLAKSPLVEGYRFPKLRNLVCGAAPLGSEVMELVRERLGVPTRQGFGMTETTAMCLMCPVALSMKHPKSVGFLIANMKAKIVDPVSGKELSVGQEGELVLQGPNVMKGYLNNPFATAQTIDNDGWLHTVDDKGMFYIVDRLKELIKYKGFQVPPAELEAYLLDHPAIADAAVIGIPNESSGEVPRAFVILKASMTSCTESDIISYIDKKVAPHKRLRGGVEFVKEIPKSPSGKILRRVLRERRVSFGSAKL
ncbi:acetyl-CoA synthetase-like protein [Rhizoclosmatium globosum]|uniref:Acetyl-CoA synthetase-like protein n=1 Tax=Rhizoclosmatium globosum TaxID=329046 RepID=A0A1Y2D3B2_9FUNG|nr:acetyl-CoA synthetase-like protein [Rhizoclosmatium globosum]|eukprot:ORY53783.1 acetyl-CoA synthetase-like protein [Rhizoclosmatium globosum]